MSHVSLLYHIVFRTKSSKRTIFEAHESELYAYIWGILKNKKCHLFRIGGMPEHIHMLVSIPANQSLSSLMNVLKAESSKWMKASGLFPAFEQWGNGYAAFTYAMRDKDMIIRYIINQKEHHRSVSFEDEFRAIMRENEQDPDTDLFLKDD